jgi:hypothetical protein
MEKEATAGANGPTYYKCYLVLGNGVEKTALVDL